LALVPKGNGALLAQVPTGTSAGGNKRGTYAVDLVRFRLNAANVASGDYSFLAGGYDNKASASYSAVAGGQGNFATGNSSFVGGGIDNQANNLSSVVAGGRLNVASGDYSAIGGGREHIANSAFSTVSGGAYGSTRGVIGYHAFPACNGPILPVPGGLSQAGLLVLGAETTDATPTVIRSNTSAASTTNQLILPNNSAYYFKGSVIANVTGAGATKWPSWNHYSVGVQTRNH